MRRREFAAELARVQARHAAELVDLREELEEAHADELDRRDAEAASVLAGVKAELADARGETIRDSFALLVRERDEAIARAAALAGECEVLTYERDAARHNADTANAAVVAWSESWHVLLGRNRELLAAAGAVLPDLAWGIEHRPRGGTKTKARLRMEHLAAVLDLAGEPTDDDIEGAA